MQQLRQTMLSQTELAASKRRFGLFSQPPPIAVGDDGPYLEKIHSRAQNGKPITLPRNMLGGASRSGILKGSYISVPDNIAVGDKYLDPEKIDYLYETKFHKKGEIHQKQFIPGSGFKNLSVLPYKHTDENPIAKAKPARDETGRVITQIKNFTSNPMSKVIHDHFKPLKHIIDPYQRKDMIDSQERKLSNQKMLPETFRSMSHGNILFSKTKEMFGFDEKAKEINSNSKSPFGISPPKKFSHQAKFKLARGGHGDPLGKYPEFIMPETNTKSQILRRAKRQKGDKQDWKPNGNKSLSRPTPSISYSLVNLRRGSRL